jgi:hypothetical protein
VFCRTCTVVCYIKKIQILIVLQAPAGRSRECEDEDGDEEEEESSLTDDSDDGGVMGLCPCADCAQSPRKLACVKVC